MTPPRGSRGLDDEIYARRRRKRRRVERKHTRRRAVVLALVAVLCAPLRRRGRRRHRRRHLRLVLRPELAAAGRDRLEHVHLRRRQLPARRDPGRAEPAAGPVQADQRLDAEGDRRDRGPALLPARRDRRRGHRTRALEERQRRPGGRGRLDDHAAARAQPLHRAREDGRAEAEGSVPRDQARQGLGEEPDPRHLHEPGLLRQPRLRDRGGRADLLLQARERAEPPRGGDARRAAAGAERLQPVPEGRGREGPAQPGSAGAPERGRHHAGAVRLGGQARARAQGRQALQGDPRARLLRLRPRPADRTSTAPAPSARAGSRSTRRSTLASSVRRRRRSGRRSTSTTTRRRA